MTTVNADTREKIADIAMGLLTERFGDDFVFGPIIVIPRTDYDGDEYLDVSIIYDGDMKKLDLDWTIRIGRMMEPELLEIGVTGWLTHSFIEKSDWEAGPPK